jgi:hypothetical protein
MMMTREIKVSGALPSLGPDDITVDEGDFTAIASFVFSDGSRFPLLIRRAHAFEMEGGRGPEENH